MSDYQEAIHTKIVATVGPSSSDPGIIDELVAVGVSTVRMNFSHGSWDEHAERLASVMGAAERQGRHVAVLQDLQGPRIRIGEMAPGVHLEPGSLFVFDDRHSIGDASGVALSFIDELALALRPGDRILLADGALELAVVETARRRIRATVRVGGDLASRKGANFPRAMIELPALTEKDLADIDFAREHAVDFIALSFVSSAQDVATLRKHLADRGLKTPIIAKIERPQAVDAIVDIVAEADGIMVARGDLALEIGAAAVPVVQKRIIRTANAGAKPVITATQMLESMIRNPTPTRAETSDVANAILDGSDALMLSGETAIGRYPVKAVAEMSAIARATEPAMAFSRIGGRKQRLIDDSVAQAVSEAAVDVARGLGVRAIAAATTSGWTPRLVAKYRPEMRLVGLAYDPAVCRRLAIVWGVEPVVVVPYDDTDEMVRLAGEALEALGIAAEGDSFVLVSGQPIGTAGSTNMVQVRRVGDWRR